MHEMKQSGNRLLFICRYGKKFLKKMIKNIDIEIDTWYINTALFGRGDAEIFEN